MTSPDTAPDATRDDRPDETPDTWGAFPRLTDEQIAHLSTCGPGVTRRSTSTGEVLVAAGTRVRPFVVVLHGVVEVFDGYGTPKAARISAHGPGRFLDEIGLLTGQPAFVTSVVRQPGEILSVPVEDLRSAVSRDPALGDLILRAYMARRDILLGLDAGIRLVGSRYSASTQRLREFMARNRVPHRFIDVESDTAAETLLVGLGLAPSDTPVVLLATAILRNPSNAELARAVGWPIPTTPTAVHDLVIVGAGPAGLAAAVYGASEGLTTAVVDAVAAGGQAGTSSRIENYLGFPAGISGAELADRAIIQAEKFGATISVPAEAVRLDSDDEHHAIHLDNGSTLHARTVLIATGARYRRLDVPRLSQFEGISVFYAATLIEARACTARPIVVVGGGNSAGQAALYLAAQAETVRLLIRHHDLGQDMSRYLVDQIEADPRITVVRNVTVRDLLGDHGSLRAVVVEDNTSGARTTIEANALFVFIGAEPCTAWLAGVIALDPAGFIRTGMEVVNSAGADNWPSGRPPALLETSRSGVLAVGDVRSGSIKRVASAVGEGSMAVRLVHQYLTDAGRPNGSM